MSNKEKKKAVHQLSIFADSFQFQLQDQLEDCDYPEHWNDALLTQLYVIGHRILGIGTVRDLDVDLTLEIFAEKMDDRETSSEPDVGQFDHAVQCTLEIDSGKLLITGCSTDYEETIKLEVKPGQYGVRIFWSNLDSTDELGFEGEDHYLIQLWPDTVLEERIIKSWRNLAFQMNPHNN